MGTKKASSVLPSPQGHLIKVSLFVFQVISPISPPVSYDAAQVDRWRFDEQQRALGFEKMDSFLREYKSLQVSFSFRIPL